MNKILLLSDDSEMINIFKNYFINNSFFHFDIRNNVQNINLYDYQLIIIDYILKEIDSFELLNNLDKSIKKVVILPFYSIDLINIGGHLEINLLFIKPFSLKSLEEQLKIAFNYNMSFNEILDYQISILFKNIGLTNKYKGVKYLQEIIFLIFNEKHNIDSKLYRILANRHNKKIDCIEKNIQYAINKSLNKMKYEDRLDTYGYVADYDNGNISNLDFINIIVDKIKYELNKKN